MDDSVIIRDVSCHEVQENLAATDVAMLTSLVVYDEALPYAEENNELILPPNLKTSISPPTTIVTPTNRKSTVP